MKRMRPARLLVMAAIHFPVMYLVMFSMISGSGEFENNLNMAYMAGMMTAPMLLIEVLLMGQMYDNRSALFAIATASVVVFVLLFAFTRYQTAIGDAQFLRSMIPHHSGAILMCRAAKLSDPEIRRLCDGIVRSQRDEIEQMKRILARSN